MKNYKTLTWFIFLFIISKTTCSQNQAPKLDAGATIRQAYCPQTQIVIAPDFTITGDSDFEIDAFSIQISSGYSRNTDRLSLTGTHSTINEDWSEVEGKLKLTPKEGTQILYTAIQKAVREIVFESSSNTVIGEKYFSFTIGTANYLPSTGHFYVFEPDLDITWTEAKIKAEGKTYFGLQGYLATILSLEENQIAAKQITGTGWIGANDADEEGVWNWVTGPEGVTNFWNGAADGSAAINPATGTPMYSNWFAGLEPNNFDNNEHYAHIKKNASTWNDLKNAADGPMSTEYRAEGYIIEYGGTDTDPKLQISASTSIYIPRIVSVNNIEVCSNSSVILTATATEGPIFWYDAITGGNLLEKGNTFTTPVLTNSKTYYATASPEGCDTSDRLAAVVTVNAVPIANDPVDTLICDDNGDGFYSFDFDTNTTPQILNDQAITEFEVLYFENYSDAEANVAGTNITSPYTNTTAFTLETIYARIHNKNDNSCSAIVDFNIFVSRTPIPTQPVPYRICDNQESSSDTDGIVTTFLLNTRDLEIAGSLDANQYNITYHSTQNGADINIPSTVIDKDSKYSVTDFQTVFIRIENKDNTTCYDATKNLALFVDPLPTVTGITQLKQCDTDADKQTTFNLTEAQINISSNFKSEDFKYFPTETAAIKGAPEVADKTSYFVNTTGEAWVRTLSNENCYRISKIELTVSYTPNEPYQEIFISCDDFLDTDGNDTVTNSDTDGITFFNFSIATSEITNDEDVDVEFYETERERTQSINRIQLSQNIANYRNKNIPNTSGNPFPIYYKLISKSNNNCQGLGQIYLQIDPVPIANTPANFDLCDDDLSGNTTDGINRRINLKDREAAVLGVTQTPLDYDVTFHTSQLDANNLNSLGIPDATNFSNTPQAGFVKGDISEQTIFVRVQDKITLCTSSLTSFKVIVSPIPSVSKTITPFAVFDLDTDPRNRMAENIDLTTKNDEILTGKKNHRVAYYLTQPDAENNVEIINPTDFQNIISLTSFPTNFTSDDPAIQTIFFKIIDLGGNQCPSIFATFQVVIYPEPNIPLNISNYSDCDNISDIDADDANGRNGDISLKNKIPTILSNYLPAEFADFSVSFYASLTAAEIGDPTNILDENNFENSTNGQEIFVRVENIKNTPIVCVNARLSFKIMINPLPDFTVRGEENIENPRIVCLNNTPLTLEAENPLATYAYQWTNAAGNPLGNDRTLDVTTAGKYTVTVSEISPIGCSRKKTIVVEESNTATLDKNNITIIDEGNAIGNENNLSIVIDAITNDLGPGDYQFALRNDDKNTTTLFQDEPLFENLEGGIYTIIVNDKNGCTPDAILQVSVLQFPKFFTPNGDGINDTWILKGVNKAFYPNSSINIFNRFGKLVAQIAIDEQGWNGTYNSKKLSSDDYWYTIILIPANTSKPTINKSGNFSLIRK
jgi:gliding motility-associated-like protein